MITEKFYKIELKIKVTKNSKLLDILETTLLEFKNSTLTFNGNFLMITTSLNENNVNDFLTNCETTIYPLEDIVAYRTYKHKD